MGEIFFFFFFKMNEKKYYNFLLSYFSYALIKYGSYLTHRIYIFLKETCSTPSHQLYKISYPNL